MSFFSCILLTFAILKLYVVFISAVVWHSL